MNKEIKVCHVHGVTYLNDTKNHVKISQAGRFHLLVEVRPDSSEKRSNAIACRVTSSYFGTCFEVEDLSKEDTEASLFLVSIDTDDIVKHGAELVIALTDGVLTYTLSG